MTRAIWSAPPPVPAGTMNSTVLVGSHAFAAGAKRLAAMAVAATMADPRHRMFITPIGSSQTDCTRCYILARDLGYRVPNRQGCAACNIALLTVEIRTAGGAEVMDEQ